MSSRRLTSLGAVAMVFVIILAGCQAPSTEEPFEPRLLLNPLSVKIVPGGTEIVKIVPTEVPGTPQTYTAECDSEDVVDIEVGDSTITVTGLDYGRVNIRVSCGAGLTGTLPVQVYDPMILETDELIISFVDTFEYRWSSEAAPGCSLDTASFYHPVTRDGFKALGSLGFGEYSNPNGERWIMVVKAKPGSNALKPPIGYVGRWDSEGSGALHDGSIWEPLPPAGYKALGMLAQRGFLWPSTGDMVCVREDLTIQGAAGDYFFWGRTPARHYIWCWQIDPPRVGPHDYTYLSTGTFMSVDNPFFPIYLIANVLKVELPMLAEAPPGAFLPELTGYDVPPPHTAPVMVKEMLVPWTIVKDGDFNNLWRLHNSPFYRLERQVFYRLVYHNVNQTSTLQTNSILIRSGVTTEASETFLEKTGGSLTAGGGFNLLDMFTATSYGTYSTEFGYESQTSVTELEETEVTTSINAPPGKAVALWQRFSRFALKRHDGTVLTPVAATEFGIRESYVTDEYPD